MAIGETIDDSVAHPEHSLTVTIYAQNSLPQDKLVRLLSHLSKTPDDYRILVYFNDQKSAGIEISGSKELE